MTMFRFSFLLLVGSCLMQSLAAPLAMAAKEGTPTGEPIVYKTVDGQELRLYLHKPSGWKASDQRPATVFFHGGGWNHGGPWLLNYQAEELAKRGMVTMSVQYRLTAKSGIPTVCCQDAKSAMRWARSHARELGIDPNRIAASGSSAGGHLSAFVGLVDGLDDLNDDLAISPRPNALVLFCPVVNLGPDTFSHNRVGERYKEFSPLHNIRPGAPPTIILIGANDQYITRKTIADFRDQMLKVGTRCEVVFYEGLEHGFMQTPRWAARSLGDADKFLVSLGWLSAPAESE